MTLPDPPPLLDFHGDWQRYEQELHGIFIEDIAQAGLQFHGQGVSCRRHPETAGRWAAFWHLVQEGSTEDDRTPDLRRCERLRWIRWIIENAGVHPEIDEWQNRRKSEINTLLWYQEEYLVVLSQRGNYWLLKTAYCTEQPKRKAQLRRERDNFRRAGQPAGGGTQNS